MTKIIRFLAICTIGFALATSSIALAQTYTAVNFPGATLTELIGGPNPQGTSVGGYTLTAGGALHGFTLRNGVFTPFDPPGSTFTTVNFINPRGNIVGAFVDAGGVSHGFVLSGGTYTTVDYPGAAGTVLSSVNPSGELSGATCSDPACGVFGATNVTHSFLSVQERRLLGDLRSTRRSQQYCQRRDPLWRSRWCFHRPQWNDMFHTVPRLHTIPRVVCHH